MKHIIILIILICLIFSNKLYLKYIKYRRKKILYVRNYIYKHFIELYIYLPSTNLMVYDLSKPCNNIEFWLNYIKNQERKYNK